MMKRWNIIIPFLFLWIVVALMGPAVSQAAPTVEFAQKTAEGAEGLTAVTEVILSEASTAVVTVEYKVTGGTALRGEDFNLVDGSLTFQPGEISKTIPVQIIDDSIKEEDETILLTLSNPYNAELGKNITFTYTILDNDTVSVAFTSETSSDAESVSPCSLEVKLSRAAQETVTVNYKVSGTATGNGVDYTLPEGTLTFKAGETSQKIIIDITDNGLQEPDKTIVVTLSEPTNAKLGRMNSHTHWILDDDGPQQNIYLFKQEVDSVEAGKKLVIIGPKTMTVNPRGIAVDKSGNLYITDQGPSKGKKEGSILMWPKGKKKVLRIITGLTQPGDVELSPDQKKLIIAGPKGDIYRNELGLSIGLANIDPFSGNTRVHLFSQASGEKVAKVSPDGYFHFPGLLVPGQPKNLYADVEYNGKTKRYSLNLGQPGESGEPYGHAVIDLDF
jgi:DNA-binding beta-propeller fold protein YncE